MAKDIDNEMAKSIGIKLMLARDNAELTRDELSEKADVEANSIYRYETGKQVPNFPTVIRLAKGLGVSVADLVPDDYIAKTEDDPEGVLELFYGTYSCTVFFLPNGRVGEEELIFSTKR